MHTDNPVISVLAAVVGASVLWWKCVDVITSSSVSAVCPRVTAWLHDCMTPPTLHAAYCGHLPANHLQLALTHTATIAKVLVHTHRCQYCQYQHIKITTSTQLHPVYASANAANMTMFMFTLACKISLDDIYSWCRVYCGRVSRRRWRHPEC